MFVEHCFVGIFVGADLSLVPQSILALLTKDDSKCCFNNFCAQQIHATCLKEHFALCYTVVRHQTCVQGEHTHTVCNERLLTAVTLAHMQVASLRVKQ